MDRQTKQNKTKNKTKTSKQTNEQTNNQISAEEVKSSLAGRTFAWHTVPPHTRRPREIANSFLVLGLNDIYLATNTGSLTFDIGQLFLILPTSQ
jgi:hypothetical protein